MSGIIPMVPPKSGFIDGKLNIQLETSLTFDEILTCIPATRAIFEELSQKGWRYYFIEGYGVVIKELEVASSPYIFQIKEHPGGGFIYSLLVDFGRLLPSLQLKSIIDLQRFVVNVSGNYYPRSVTIDLRNNEITYVHEALGLSAQERLSEKAEDTLNILRWLVQVKKFKLGGSNKQKYQNLIHYLER